MIKIIITQDAIETLLPEIAEVEGAGACVDFKGMIRPLEAGEKIAGIDFEAYVEMAEKVMQQKLEVLQQKYGFLAAEVIHRYGKVRVGELAISVRIWAAHRKEAYLANLEFMDELKKDVPIWKVATF